MFQSVTVWPSLPPAGLTCDHVKNVEWAQRMMPPEIRHVVKTIQVTPAFCRTRPFFERRPED